MNSVSLSLFHFVEAAKQANDKERFVLSSNGITTKSNPYPFPCLDSTRLQNQKVWRCFKQALYETYHADRISRMCHRYHIDLDRMEKQGSPLQKKHVEMFLIGGQKLFVEDLHRMSYIDPKWLPLEEIQNQIVRLNPYPIVSNLVARNLDGGPSVLKANWVHDPLLMDKEMVTLLQDLPKLSSFSFLERLTKTIANRELEEGMFMAVAGVHGGEDYYTVARKICGEGLVAYALKPVSNYSFLKPLIIFRPTQCSLVGEDAPQSWLNDLELDVGSRGYEATKMQFQELMTDRSFCPEGETVEISGFSLGGTHAQHFLCDFWRQVSKAVFFNDPSREPQYAEQFAREVNTLEKDKHKLAIEIYRTKGDIAHYIGKKHIGWGVTHPDVDVEIIELDSVEETVLSRVGLHGMRFFDQAGAGFIAARYGKEEINRLLDNAQRGRDVLHWERLRRFWRHICVPIIFFVHKINYFSWRYLGHSLFRYTEQKKKLF